MWRLCNTQYSNMLCITTWYANAQQCETGQRKYQENGICTAQQNDIRWIIWHYKLSQFLNWVFLSLSLSNGTSMISLIIPPKDQISRVAKMLADEFGTASNIKSRVNRLSVLGAITSVQQRLKLYNKGAWLFYFMNTFIPSLNAEKARQFKSYSCS